MKKVALIAVLLMAAPAFGNLVTNGDFSAGSAGWTGYMSPWGTGISWDAGSGAMVGTGGTGSSAQYQLLTGLIPGEAYHIEAELVAGDGDLNWIEVLFMPDDGRSMADQLDSGPLNSAIISKVDGWGMNGGMPSGPHADLAAWYYPSGPNTKDIVSTGTVMIVAVKTGSGGAGTYAAFDNIVVTPEPASLALVAFGGLPLLLRRRRA